MYIHALENSNNKTSFAKFDKMFWQNLPTLEDERPPPRFNDTSHCITAIEKEEISDVALDKCSVYFLH